MASNNPSRLSDDELVAEVKRLARCEREATVELITHLAEMDKRRLHLGAGFPSLFAYCTEILRLSEHEAYHRIAAARAARRSPVLLRMLAEGSLNLTSVRLLAPHLDEDNPEGLLAVASGRSKRELEELLARRFPQPQVASSIRKLPDPRPTLEPWATLAASGAAVAASGAAVARATPAGAADEPRGAAPPSPASAVSFAAVPPPPSRQRAVVTPLAPERYQITFTAGVETREKLRLAQDLLRHAIPNGDPAAVIDRALTALLKELAREKFAATGQPQASRGPGGSAGPRGPGGPASRSRHIPAEVKRAVWVRDVGRCAFVGKDKRRCNERAFVEFHHLQPYAAGGPATAENIQLRCRAHNAYEADLYYGPRASAGFVEEPVAPYVGLRGGDATRSGPSCVAATQVLRTTQRERPKVRYRNPAAASYARSGSP